MAVNNVTQANFDTEVLQSAQPVLVDFWASWCGPCQMMGPVVEAVAKVHTGLKVCKVNTDENIDLAVKLGIDSIPALLLFKNGQLAARTVGAQPPQQIEDWLRANGAI